MHIFTIWISLSKLYHNKLYRIYIRHGVRIRIQWPQMTMVEASNHQVDYANYGCSLPTAAISLTPSYAVASCGQIYGVTPAQIATAGRPLTGDSHPAQHPAVGSAHLCSVSSWQTCCFSPDWLPQFSLCLSSSNSVKNAAADQSIQRDVITDANFL